MATYLVIDPDECIDCGACIPECPVEAIFTDTDVPEEEQEWIEMPQTKDIEVHRYEVLDIRPNVVLELYCIIHGKK